MDNANKRELKINLPESEMTGRYSNLALISHTREEFVFDFATMLPGQPGTARVVSRIIMTPENAKRLLAALQDNVNKYNAGQNGQQDYHMPINFSTKGEA